MTKTVFIVRHCQADGQSPDAWITTDGQALAAALADLLEPMGVERIVSSPFVRAHQSILPLAERLGLPIDVDNRLAERVLGVNGPDWLDRLRATFLDFDLRFPGGESNREAMTRGVAAVDDALRRDVATIVIVTHGNLLTLLLRHFDPRFGFDQWLDLTNPDVFRVAVGDTEASVVRVWRSSDE